MDPPLPPALAGLFAVILRGSVLSKLIPELLCFLFTVYPELHGSVMGSGSFSPNCPFRIGDGAIKWRGASGSAVGCGSLRERGRWCELCLWPPPRSPALRQAALGRAVAVWQQQA